MANTDRAFICLAIAEREKTIAGAQKMLTTADERRRVAIEEFISDLEAENRKVRQYYGIGKVRAV